MIVQIYETQSPSEARALIEIGVSNVGVLVGDGEFPREIPAEDAHEVFRAVQGRATRVGLSLSANTDQIAKIAEMLRPDILHVGAATDRLSPQEFVALRREFPAVQFMRAIPVTGREAIDLARAYDEVADWLLLDSHTPGDSQIGAVGRPHDWSISAKIVSAVSTPVILAGGLGPSNVGQAIRQVRPAGVDSKTLTDRQSGVGKDLQRVARFVQATRRAI